MISIKNKVHNYLLVKKEIKNFDYKKWHPFDQVCLCRLLIEEGREKGYYYIDSLNDISWKTFYLLDNDTIYKLTNAGEKFLDDTLIRQIQCQNGLKNGTYLFFKEYFEIINKDYKERLNKDRYELLNMFDDLDKRLREEYKQYGELCLQDFIINRRIKFLRYEFNRMQKENVKGQDKSNEK